MCQSVWTVRRARIVGCTTCRCLLVHATKDSFVPKRRIPQIRSQYLEAHSQVDPLGVGYVQLVTIVHAVQQFPTRVVRDHTTTWLSNQDVVSVPNHTFVLVES